MYNIGIDLGGTNIKVGVTDEDYRITGRSSIKTGLPRSGEEIVDSIIEAIEYACNDAGKKLSETDFIGIGTPGAVDGKNGIVIYSNNLGFRNFSLGRMLSEKTGKNVRVVNDANAAAYGEVLCGGGRGCKDAVIVTIGTGVGSGIIIGGRIYEGFNYCAGELGHTVIEYGGRKCTCGRRGCFEAYSSATALIDMTRNAMMDDKSSEMWRIAGSIEEVDGKTAFDGMRAGDKTAEKVVDTYISYLGCGLVNIVNTFQPELILIGGGVCKEGEFLTKPLRKIIANDSYKIDGAAIPRLEIAKLGNDAGIIGAAFLYKMDVGRVK